MSILNITSFGASQNNPDNTDVIQRVLDEGANNTVYVPPGEFKVSTEQAKALRIRSDTTLKIDGALRAIPTAGFNVTMLVVENVKNVNIVGPGSLIGERSQHLAHGPARQLGNIYLNNSSNVALSGGLLLSNSFCDGIMVVKGWNVTMNGVACNNNSRNGLSIISCNTMSVKNCVFANTNETVDYTAAEAAAAGVPNWKGKPIMPQAGIDVEPNEPADMLLALTITQNHFVSNKGPGMFWAWDDAPNRRGIFCVTNEFNQHYKDGSGAPTSGRLASQRVLPNLLYAACRWIPGYDYWYWPKELTIS